MPLLVDAHVHLQNCFRLGPFLDGAVHNFRSAVNHGGSIGPGYLLLTDMTGQDTFDRIRGEGPKHGWSFEATEEEESLIALKDGKPALVLVSGRQIACREGIEWLALGTRLCFQDGLPLLESLREIRKVQALPVLPWGFGKWWFGRGRVVKQLIVNECNSSIPDRIFLGDNGGRISLLGQPSAFAIARREGLRILPGTDPLPFQSHENRAGSYAFLIEGRTDTTVPWRHLRDALTTDRALEPLGRLESPFSFVRQQVAMQLRKRGIGGA